MEISFNTNPGDHRMTNGFGTASYKIITSMQHLGYKVPYDDKKSPVQLNFASPDFYKIRNNQYTIGYTPWESTELPEKWIPNLKKVDELWATSNFVKNIFEDYGFKVHQVYPHGIDEMWKPVKRKPKDKIRFLHQGCPAPRKGGQIAVDAFRKAFGNANDVELTIKSFGIPEVRRKDSEGNILDRVDDYNNVVLDERIIDAKLLPSYYNKFNVMIYPTWGEGFGFIPLQSAATGMPTVTTSWWCDYSKYILPLNYTVKKSPWQHVHMGNMSEPNFDHLVWWYKEIYNNIDKYTENAYKRSFRLHEEYDWIKVTKKVMDDLEKRLK